MGRFYYRVYIYSPNLSSVYLYNSAKDNLNKIGITYLNLNYPNLFRRKNNVLCMCIITFQKIKNNHLFSFGSFPNTMEGSITFDLVGYKIVPRKKSNQVNALCVGAKRRKERHECSYVKVQVDINKGRNIWRSFLHGTGSHNFPKNL